MVAAAALVAGVALGPRVAVGLGVLRCWGRLCVLIVHGLGGARLEGQEPPPPPLHGPTSQRPWQPLVI